MVVAYGAEGHAWPQSRLRMAHNTLINEGVGPAWFLRVWKDRLPRDAAVQAVNNLAVGIGVFALGASGEFAGQLPGRRADARSTSTALDFALKEDSRLRGMGVDPRQALGADLRPRLNLHCPSGRRPLPARDKWTPDAFQR